MKIKLDFVTNSSSCSFILNLRYVSELQLEKIFEVNSNLDEYDRYALYKNEDDNVLEGSAAMDNFQFEEFFEKLGIPGVAYEFKY